MDSSGEFGERLGRAFFARSTLVVARELLGALLVTRDADEATAGRLVEVEAYLGPGDLASHAARLRTGRVAVMSGPPGITYVYRSMGIHAMLNIVAEPDGTTGAVLIRAAEPLTGVELMARRRGLDAVRLLCSGPGRLCQAFGIGLDDHGIDITRSPRIALYRSTAPARIAAGGRIGISKAVEAPYRFFDPDSPFVSVHRRGTPIEG